MNPVEGLARFTRDELERAGGRQAAVIRTGGLGHVVRLLSLLHHTLTELDEATAAFLANVERQDQLESALGAVDTALFEEGGRLSEVVHLRVETFYALMTVLLDDAARSIERYFGPIDGVRLAAHADVQANLAAFADRKGLQAPPPSLLARAERLTTEILSDRDRHVRFGPDSPIWTASTWSCSGDASISPSTRSDLESVRPRELLDLVEDYLAEVVRYLEVNRPAV
jgi:hypothetical protein